MDPETGDKFGKLSLRGVAVTTEVARKIADELKIANLPLYGLTFTQTFFYHEASSIIMQALKTNPSLRHIYFFDNHYHRETGEYGQMLIDLLRLNQDLTTIGLVYPNLEDGILSTITDILTKNSKVIKLTLAGCNISNAGVKKIAQALQVNESLYELDLTGNDFDDEGVFAIAEALKRNKTLRILMLNDNHNSAKGELAIIQALLSNITITNVYIACHQEHTYQILRMLLDRNDLIKSLLEMVQTRTQGRVQEIREYIINNIIMAQQLGEHTVEERNLIARILVLHHEIIERIRLMIIHDEAMVQIGRLLTDGNIQNIVPQNVTDRSIQNTPPQAFPSAIQQLPMEILKIEPREVQTAVKIHYFLNRITTLH